MYAIKKITGISRGIFSLFILYIFFFWQHNFTFYCNTFILQKLPACNQVSKILLHICLHMELIDFTYIGIWKCYFLYMFALVRKEKWTIKDLGWLKIWCQFLTAFDDILSTTHRFKLSLTKCWTISLVLQRARKIMPENMKLFST